MPKLLSEAAVRQYERDGYVFPVRVMSAAETAEVRACLERYEAETGAPIRSEM